MSYENLEEEIDGEIIVLGKSDGGSHFKWFGDTVNPMKIKDKQIILPTIEEYMENLDILVRDNHINEGEYKRKTDTLQNIWRKENEEDEEDTSDEDNIDVEPMIMNGERVYLDEDTGNVYNDNIDYIGIATRLNRNTWSIFNSRNSGRAPDILTYNY